MNEELISVIVPVYNYEIITLNGKYNYCNKLQNHTVKEKARIKNIMKRFLKVKELYICFTIVLMITVASVFNKYSYKLI